MSGTLIGIFVADGAGAPMRSLARAELVRGRGIAGDRYFTETGTFSPTARKPSQEVTLIEGEQVEAFNGTTAAQIRAEDFRRNLVTRGVQLNDLVGVEFSVGFVVLKGLRLCEPCDYLARLTTSSVLQRLVHRAGLRAAIVVGGSIAVGDRISVVTAPIEPEVGV